MNDKNQNNKEHFQRIRVKKEAQGGVMGQLKCAKAEGYKRKQHRIQCAIREWAR